VRERAANQRVYNPERLLWLEKSFILDGEVFSVTKGSLMNGPQLSKVHFSWPPYRGTLIFC
jgi:hypothetical protein